MGTVATPIQETLRGHGVLPPGHSASAPHSLAGASVPFAPLLRGQADFPLRALHLRNAQHSRERDGGDLDQDIRMLALVQLGKEGNLQVELAASEGPPTSSPRQKLFDRSISGRYTKSMRRIVREPVRRPRRHGCALDQEIAHHLAVASPLPRTATSHPR